jgi:hypothetical protein
LCPCIPPIITRHCLGKHVPREIHIYPCTTEELFDMAFCMWPVLYQRKVGD